MSNIIIKTTTNNNPVPIPISPGGDFTVINNDSFFEYKHYNTTFSPTVFDSAVIIGNDNSAINPALDYSELQAHILFINN